MLADYRVLDFTDERGALCGQLLADLGAQVVRVEPLGGSPMRHALPGELMWQVYARNCESVVVDLASAAGRTQLAGLAAQADVIVDNGGETGAALAQMQAAHPRLVRVSITAFGSDGPKRDYIATDLIVQAASGTMAITGFGDSKPLRTGAITAWSHAGVAAAGAALLALRSARPNRARPARRHFRAAGVQPRRVVFTPYRLRRCIAVRSHRLSAACR